MIDEDYLYYLNNVVCSYNKTDVVLKIDELYIPKGKLVVVLGKSGAGKSTILETLGLMNNTLVAGDISFNSGERTVCYDNIWDDEQFISDIRNNYMSFVFQSTNLMNNFSVAENACIPQLLQGVSYDEAEQNVKETMELIDLKEISLNSNVANLSGGQRQRLAFVRAITPEFTVLFGDEPTGNLDEINSRELMKLLTNRVHNSKKSSIIVSHDISLSLEFADVIIVLTKDHGYGEILKQNVYTINRVESNVWFDGNNCLVEDMKTLLRNRIM